MSKTSYAKMSDEELEAAHQSVMEKRAAAELGFKEDALAVQFEVDKRAARARFGPLGPAELAALADIQAEAPVVAEE